MMMLLLAAAISLQTAPPGTVVPQPVCPYINTETVSGALQQKATLTLSQHTHAGDVCNFVAADGRLRLSVRVTPSTDPGLDYAKARSVCAGEAKVVNALGNEAWRCRVARDPDSEAIFGRVRDTVFYVEISGMADATTLHDKAALAAEQVANTLY